MTQEYAVPGDDTSRQTERPKTSNLFRRMADQIDRNEGSAFGGAVVICPPGGGDPVELLMLNSLKDPAQFWGAVDATVKFALANLDEQARNAQAFQRR